MLQQKVTIQPVSDALLQGTVSAPASKSMMQRAIAAAWLRGGRLVLYNPGRSEDDLAAIGIVKALGATVAEDENMLVIAAERVGQEGPPLMLHCGESGLSVRMFTPIAALTGRTIEVDGSGSLRNRPLDFFDTVLPGLGVSVLTNDGKLPVRITGPLQPGNITIDAALSSQFLTGLLMAYAGSAITEDVTIRVTHLSSKPYIDMTLQVMADFGLPVPGQQDYRQFIFRKAKHKILAGPLSYTIEGDWSSAAFLMVAGAIAGEQVMITGLDVFSAQADRAILQPLMECGCRVSIEEKRITVSVSGALRPFQFDATDCPDLFPPLVALAAYCSGTSVIEGIHRLRHKESDRAHTLQQTFSVLGIELSFQDDLMLIKGGSGLQGGAVSSHHDHRIAMACAVAALKAEGPVTIEDAAAVNKSYPDFYDHLALLGAVINKS